MKIRPGMRENRGPDRSETQVAGTGRRMVSFGSRLGYKERKRRRLTSRGRSPRPRRAEVAGETRTMPRNLSRRDLLLAGGAAWVGAGALGRALGASRKAPKKVLFFTKSSGYPHSVVTRRGRPARARRADPDRGRQGARLRGRRLQGRPTVRARQDRPVGCLRLLHHRQPEHAGHRQVAAHLGRRREGPLRRHSRRQGLHRHALRDRLVRPPSPPRQGRRGPVRPDDRRRVRHGHGPQQKVTIEVVDPHFPGLEKGFGEVKRVHPQRRVVCPQEPARRPSRDHGPGHQGDAGQGCTTGPTTP